MRFARCDLAEVQVPAAPFVNIASVSGYDRVPGHLPDTPAPKSAVDRMTRVAAMEAGKLGYRACGSNCLYPRPCPH